MCRPKRSCSCAAWISGQHRRDLDAQHPVSDRITCWHHQSNFAHLRREQAVGMASRVGKSPQGKLDGQQRLEATSPSRPVRLAEKAKSSRVHHEPLRGWLGRRRPLKRRLGCAYRCRRSSACSVLRSPDPRLGGRATLPPRASSADQGLPRSANHDSPHRPQLPPSRKGKFEWDAEYVSVRERDSAPLRGVARCYRVCCGEAPRRYEFLGFGAALRLLPTRASMGTVLIEPTEIRRHRGEMATGPTRHAISIGGSRPTSGCRASVDRRLPGWVASDGSRIKSVDLVISCPSGTPFLFAAGTPRAYAPGSFATSSRGCRFCETATSGWRRRSHRLGSSAPAKSAELWRLEPGWTGFAR